MGTWTFNSSSNYPIENAKLNGVPCKFLNKNKMKMLRIKAVFLLTAMFVPLSQRAQTPGIWEREADQNGFMGFYDKNGKCMIEPLFWDADKQFYSQVTGVQPRENDYLQLIDRKGNLVVKDKYRFIIPSSSWRYVEVREMNNKEHLIDYQGHPLTKQYNSIDNISPCGNYLPMSRYVSLGYWYKITPLIAINEDTGTTELLGAGLRPFVQMEKSRCKIECFGYVPFSISIDDGYKSWLINLEGKELTPRSFILEPVKLDKDLLLNETALIGLYSQEQLDSIYVLSIIDDEGLDQKGRYKYCKVLSITGENICAQVKYKYNAMNDVINKKKFIQKYIVPYLLQKQANDALFEKKLHQPFKRYVADFTATMEMLPKNTSNAGSLVAQLRKEKETAVRRHATPKVEAEKKAKAEAEKKAKAEAEKQAREQAEAQRRAQINSYSLSNTSTTYNTTTTNNTTIEQTTYGNSSTSQSSTPQHKHPLTWYTNLYEKFERTAESCYRILTSNGTRTTQGGKKVKGSIGSAAVVSSPQFINNQRMALRKAQQEMKRIRHNAKLDGYNMQPSQYETVVVTIHYQ